MICAYTRLMTLGMKRRVSSSCVLILMVGTLALEACRSPLSWPGLGGERATRDQAAGARPFDSAAAATILQRNPDSPTADLRIIDVVFDVVQLAIPIEGQRHSRKIWNHVDEMRVDPEVVARLARNGLRVGAASPGTWPAIRAIVDTADADVRRDRLVAQPGMPLLIKLASISQEESIFSYTANGRLVGKTFAAGEKLLSIDYAFHPELGGCTDLQLTLEIRRDRGVMTWERRGGIIRQVPAFDLHLFADVSILLTLNPDEFLVLGLSDEPPNEYLVGGRFLISERAGKRYETVLCITPKPYQTRGVKRTTR